MKPIPKKLLIHSVKSVQTASTDMWGNKTAGESTDLTFVRLEPSSMLKYDKQNQQIQLNAVLFYDCRNSRPQGFDFSHAERIEHGGKAYKIVSIDLLNDERSLHHIEVGLCL